MAKEKTPDAPASEAVAPAPAETKMAKLPPPSALQVRLRSAADTITEALELCSIDVIKTLQPMVQTVQLAAGVALMRQALTDEIVKELFMPLMGSKLGFRTDRDKPNPEKPHLKPYGVDVVRDVAIEALTRGFYMTGNETNIIAESAYFTREGFTRKVYTFPGLTDLQITPGMPVFANDQRSAAVPIEVHWRLNGQRDQMLCTVHKDPTGALNIDARINVRLNKGMGPDAAIGKAMRKVLYRLFERLHGARYMPAEGDALEVEGSAAGEFAPPPVPVAGSQPAAGTASAMASLISRAKPGAPVTANTPPPDTSAPPDSERPADQPAEPEPEMTDAEKLAREVAENEREERAAQKRQEEEDAKS